MKQSAIKFHFTAQLYTTIRSFFYFHERSFLLQCFYELRSRKKNTWFLFYGHKRFYYRVTFRWNSLVVLVIRKSLLIERIFSPINPPDTFIPLHGTLIFHQMIFNEFIHQHTDFGKFINWNHGKLWNQKPIGGRKSTDSTLYSNIHSDICTLCCHRVEFIHRHYKSSAWEMTKREKQNSCTQAEW